MTTPFHLAFPVRDVEEARQFYGGILGCPEGRSAATWVDFNLYGHQIVAHLVRGYNAAASHNAVDGDPVPVPHFGAALTVDEFHSLAERLKWTMFFHDPSGNALEFKAMTNPDNLFAKYTVTD
ncbi:hypothetical protein GPECTOR_7g1144 [Gonium pectorale]|uniref:VOC domain-containing protein n=1 Tax=Gonium pectorale TaxID=33097 RepID=A0A150GV85_GONPE|nr:hypothetical protein GPECTOR_7g1144 [Gonium pectorale]|eukprot:KXZ53250.1 hypothetical protein GPECTOR_7g1144 [Gonium pectorale]